MSEISHSPDADDEAAIRHDMTGEYMPGLVDMLIEKRRQYGVWDINRWGAFGVVVRLSDKYERLANLIKNPQPDKDAAATLDTIDDIIGYALILRRVMLYGRW